MNTVQAAKPRKETARQARLRKIGEFAAHLSSSPNVSTAAYYVGISKSQATRWLRSAEFLTAFKELHRPTDQAIGALARSLCIPALKAAAQLIGDSTAPATAKTQALKIIMSMNLEYDDKNRLVEEIEELKALVKAYKAERDRVR